MIRWYPSGYLLLWSALLSADHERIDMYFSKIHTMQMYLRMVQQQLGSCSSLPNQITSYDNAIIGTQAVSEFVCNCINIGTLPKVQGSIALGNIAVGLVLATYSLLQRFAEIWQNKKAYRSAVEQMQYIDMIIQYPHLVLIEYQIKIMDLLIDMCCFGTLPEQVFARIHLVAMVLSGPYERYTKKQAKKLYKNYFDKEGRLVSIERFAGNYPYYKFHSKVCSDWHQLILLADKYSTTFTLLFRSSYVHLVHNDYNQRLLSIIDAGMHGDMERVVKLCHQQTDPIILELYSFYGLRIEA